MRLRPTIQVLGLALTLSLTTGFLPSCDADVVEAVRRALEGGVDTPEREAEVAAVIAAIEHDLGGIASETLLERMATQGVAGLGIAVVNQGRVEWLEAYGLHDAISGAPMGRLTRQQGASLSKPTTALALLRLVHQGVVELDAPLNAALTSWQIPDNAFTENEPVTLRRVLSHTAGINNSGFLGYAPTAPVPTLLQVLDGTPPANSGPIRVVQPPGTDWMYSGGAYTVLAQVLEDQTGESFPSWMFEHVFAPLGMSRSTFAQPLVGPGFDGAATAFIFGNPVPAFTYPELPAAGLWTTPLDMARMVVGIQKAIAGEPGAILPPALAAEMITPQSPQPSPFEIGLGLDPRMGLGLFLSEGSDPGWFWHTGGNVGYSCVLVGDTRGLGYGAVVMTNSFPGGRPLAWEIINAVADLYGWPEWNDFGL